MTVTEIMARGVANGLAAASGESVPSDAEWLNGHPEGLAIFAAQAEGALAALTEAGFAIVPIEPTEQMLANGLFEAECCTDDWTAKAACLPGHVWKAMVRAA